MEPIPQLQLPSGTTLYQLDSGRLVSIEEISIENTFRGVLEGDPIFISRIIWQQTPERLLREFGENILIVKPPGEILPRYRFVVGLHSDSLPDELRWRLDCVPNKPPGEYHWDFSFATVCWFQHDLNENLVECVYRGVKGLDWEKYAKNSGD